MNFSVIKLTIADISLQQTLYIYRPFPCIHKVPTATHFYVLSIWSYVLFLLISSSPELTIRCSCSMDSVHGQDFMPNYSVTMRFIIKFTCFLSTITDVHDGSTEKKHVCHSLFFNWKECCLHNVWHLYISVFKKKWSIFLTKYICWYPAFKMFNFCDKDRDINFKLVLANVKKWVHSLKLSGTLILGTNHPKILDILHLWVVDNNQNLMASMFRTLWVVEVVYIYTILAKFFFHHNLYWFIFIMMPVNWSHYVFKKKWPLGWH